MKVAKYLLLGALAFASFAPTMAQDNKAVVEQATQVIKAKGPDYKDNVKKLYKENKKKSSGSCSYRQDFSQRERHCQRTAFRGLCALP